MRLSFPLALLTVCVATAVAAGCSAASPAPNVSAAPTITVTATQTVTQAAAPPEATPSATAATAPLALGKPFQADYVSVSVTRYDTSVRVGNGSRIQTLQVRSCVTRLPDSNPEGVGFSWAPWTLVDADGGRHEPASDRWDHLGAAYPDDTSDVHQPGECVKGLIQFDPNKTAALYARYRNDLGNVATWKLS